MGREVRRVPADWKHPVMEGLPYSDGSIRYQPKFNCSYAKRKAEWDAEKAAWERGEFPSYASEESRKMTFEEWGGEAPDPAYYMPEFPKGSCTHFQMYETCSEGSPISPVMDSPESLARWLADNGASAFGSETATYEEWLRVCNGGSAPSAVVDSHGLRSGVAALTD